MSVARLLIRGLDGTELYAAVDSKDDAKLAAGVP